MSRELAGQAAIAPAVEVRAGHPVADGKAGDVAADGAHLASAVRDRHEANACCHRISAAKHHQIAVIDRCGTHPHQYFIGPEVGNRPLAPGEAGDVAETGEFVALHFCLQRWRQIRITRLDTECAISQHCCPIVQNETSMDPLDEVFAAMRVRRALYARLETTAPWGLDFVGGQAARFGLVAKGACWLSVEGEEPTRLSEGDCYVLAHGTRYVLQDALGSATRACSEVVRDHIGGTVSVGGGGEAAVVITGVFTFEEISVRPLLDLMPRSLVARIEQGRSGVLQSVLQLLNIETETPALGSGMVVSRLAGCAFGSPAGLAAPRHPRRPGGRLDRRSPGADRRHVAIGLRQALQGQHWRNAPYLPDALAHVPRQLPVAPERTRRRGDLRPCRLQFRRRLQRSIQAGDRYHARPLPRADRYRRIAAQPGFDAEGNRMMAASRPTLSWTTPPPAADQPRPPPPSDARRRCGGPSSSC